ncbi:hypothetical protein N7478_008265 [Penicillium angulare]|uniref:uncharacterized protein n=1 Tax=Penicillium angulare TaxID=116970 RepID=UPI00253FE475|nr:uncharacterized protein N7478_008265 [Penicillium angulare]KAJ5273140.1 hypothetical protein N7478_008265 [Penicillium angulare]
MGVGDYVHSREPGQPRAPTDLAPSQRQLRAAQAKVDVPNTQLGGFQSPVRPSPPSFQEPRSIPDQQLRSAQENGARRDAFDTDVEGIDDSTIAGTSVYGFDDGQPHAFVNHDAPYTETSPRPSYLPRPVYRSRASWLDELGNKAMKKAAFDSDDPDDTSSQVTSSAGADDEGTEHLSQPAQQQQAQPQQQEQEQPQPQSSWYHSHKYRSAEEPLSKRLESFWSASKRTSKSVDQSQTNPQPRVTVDPIPEPGPQPRKLGHMLPPTAARKITLPHSMSATPRTRTRFSPPKPSLLDQLDISPSRLASEPPPQAGRTLSITAFAIDDHSDHDAGDVMDETIRLSSRRDSGHSSNVFGITNMSDFDRDESSLQVGQDPFLNHTSSTRSRRNTVINTNKRHLEPDYPPQQLYQKSFAELQDEPFEKAQSTQPPTPVKSPSLPPMPAVVPNADSTDEMGSHLLNLTGEDRRTYLSRLSVDEWESCGDQLLDQFSHLLSEMKNLRRARRHTARVFEDEIKRRHNQVEEQNQDLSVKLEEMRTGGAEVLRGRNS